MVDALSFHVEYQKTVDELVQLERRTMRATMYAVREAGRVTRREMKAAAPIYRGSRTDVDKGALKKSIKVSNRLGVEAGGVYVNKIGPKRNPRVWRYAAKAERDTGFASAGRAAAEASAGRAADLAVSKAIRGW